MTDRPPPAEVRRIERAVRKLPRLQREIFLAVRIDGFSYDYIAERAGLTVHQVERLFAEAIVNIDRNLNRRRWWERWLG
jgi:DNA-directed RNA polymerase specialized sigma24 family protein